MLKIFRKFFVVKKRRLKTKKSRQEFSLYKTQVLAQIQSRVEYFNKFYDFKFSNIKIKNTTSRWGSCSSKGNLNFNYRMVFLTEQMFDYIVVHELCHLGEFNHSQKFWDLVGKTIPNYNEIRVELKKIRMKID